MLINKKTTDVRIPLFIVKDEYGYFSAFCPALNISGQGKDEPSAMESFHLMVSIFLEETMRKGTLDKVLNELGWIHNHLDTPMPPTYDIPEHLYSHRDIEVALPVL
ncbi:MAG: hypothetical protein ABJB16_06690 [Saprospiraceae bacterium]